MPCACALRAVLAAVAMLVPVGVLAQDRLATTPLTGAWRAIEAIRTGTNPVERKSLQPGFLGFTARHYSLVLVNTNEPRGRFQDFKEPGKPTQAELEAVFRHWEPLTAQAGTYEVKGNILTTRPLAAKNQSLMDGPAQVREFEIDGNTLTLVELSAPGQPEFVTTTKWTRAE